MDRVDREKRFRQEARRERAHLRRLRLMRRAVCFLLVAILFLLALRFASRIFGRESASPAPRSSAFPAAGSMAGSGEMTVTEEEVRDKLALLRQEFPDGKYWNHAGLGAGEWSAATVTDTPCDHSAEGKAYCNSYDGATGELFPQYSPAVQCLGFASMLSDRLFGAGAPVSVHRDFDSLRLGDQIRLTYDEHSMVVVEKGADWVRVAECNADYNSCRISWGRELSRAELEGYGEKLEYITRF